MVIDIWRNTKIPSAVKNFPHQSPNYRHPVLFPHPHPDSFHRNFSSALERSHQTSASSCVRCLYMLCKAAWGTNMAYSGIPCIDWTFDTAVHLLNALADLMGVSYEEINVWIFMIVGPSLLLAGLFANVVLWQRRKRSRWTDNMGATSFTCLA